MTGKAIRNGRRSAGFNDAEINEIVERMELVGNPLRLKILSILLRGETNVTSLCSMTKLSQPGVSHHLALLRTAGLAHDDRRGRHVFYSLSDSGRAALEACERLL